MERTALDISWVSLWRIFAFGLLIAIMFLGRDVLLGLFLAIVISSGLEFVVNFLAARGVPRTMGVILIFLFAALLLILVVYTVIPLIIVDLNTALISLGETSERAWWGAALNFHPESAQSLVTAISGRLFGASSPFQTLSDLVGGVALAASVVAIAFYLSLTQNGIERFIRAVFPAAYESAVLKIYHRAFHRVGVWFRTQIALSFLAGALVLIALLLLGVRYAFLLALVTAILEIVPYIGPIVAGSLSVLAALLTSPSLALYTLIAFLGVQQIEQHFLVPVLIGRNMGLHPAIVIVALLVGLELGGVLGMIIAVPAAVVIQEVVEEWAGKRAPAGEAVEPTQAA